MDNDYRELYLSKMNRMGASRYDRALKLKQHEFVKFFNNALNREDCYIDGLLTQAVFQDHSQSNNKDLSDDKYVIVPNETIADVGSYILWRDREWLVFTEEEKTIPTHQQMKVKVVNWTVKWLNDKGNIVNNGAGYGAYVQNQTLYTLGVAYQGDLISVVNGKMMMYMQNNEDTRSIAVGTRVFIGTDVYRILFADTVSRSGLINFLMEEDTVTENDNRELGVADYWNRVVLPESNVKPNAPTYEIVGSETAKIGSIQTYSISNDMEVEEWILESIDGSNQPFYTLERDTERISLQFKNDFRYVGQTTNVIAKLTSGDIISLPVRVVKRF